MFNLRLIPFFTALLIVSACTPTVVDNYKERLKLYDKREPISDVVEPGKKKTLPPTLPIIHKYLKLQQNHFVKGLKKGESFYLPKIAEPVGSPAFKPLDYGDALIWNAVTLATYCILNQAFEQNSLYKGEPTLNLQEKIDTLWSNMKSNMITPDGRPYRHPKEKLVDNSISRDGMMGSLYLGAIAKYSKCTVADGEEGYAKKWLVPFRNYAIKHNFDIGATPDEKVVNSNDMYGATIETMKMVLNIYGESYGELESRRKKLIKKISLKDIIEGNLGSATLIDAKSFLPLSTKINEYVYEQNHYCPV